MLFFSHYIWYSSLFRNDFYNCLIFCLVAALFQNGEKNIKLIILIEVLYFFLALHAATGTSRLNNLLVLFLSLFIRWHTQPTAI